MEKQNLILREMKLSLEKKKEALDILEKYSGSNPYILYTKNAMFVQKTFQFNDFFGEFLLKLYLQFLFLILNCFLLIVIV